MRKITFAVLLCLPLLAHAQIRVAVEDGSTNGSGAGLVAQLNDDTWADFTATLVTAADIDSGAELANYDVVVLGGSGAPNDIDWTLDMANALSQFVTNGGGAILTGWGNYEMSASTPVNDVLDAIFPTQNIASTNDFDSGGATLVITQAHPIMDGLSDFSIANGCCTELNPLAPESGDTVLATMDGSQAGAGATAVSVKNVGDGFSVYLGPVFMGSESSYSNMFPALRTGDPDRLLEQAVAWAASGEVSPSSQAIFKVTKTFTDGSEDEVDVALNCNSGLPLAQEFTITGGDPDGVSFVVTNIPDSGASCTVTESGGPDGYTAELNGGAGCSWDGVTGGIFVCTIVNVADDATFTVNMDWILGEGGVEESDQVDVTITCDSDILTVNGSDVAATMSVEDTLGDGDSLIVTVDVANAEGEATCSAVQAVTQSGVESEAEGCTDVLLAPASNEVCTFTNTVFFEGIPTLNQYGMALLALLMLGVGFVGFRRFV